ncbi:MAG: hypothetical protein ACKOLZ_05045 [Verrucomicrobiota bacterium]
MLTRLLLLLALPLVAADPGKVLFIGNSYTGVNGLPKVYAEIAKSAGRPVTKVAASHPGGRTLQDHLTIKGTLDLIDQGGWDVVVVQGQSQEAALSENNPKTKWNNGSVTDFLEGGKALVGKIREKSPRGRIILYQTWARHADFWKATKTRESALSLGADPAEMLSRNGKWYGELAKATGAEVAPVGIAWGLNYASKEPLRLHSADNSHPAFAGTYLAALVIFGRTHGLPKEAPTWRGDAKASVDDATAARLLSYATGAIGR